MTDEWSGTHGPLVDPSTVPDWLTGLVEGTAGLDAAIFRRLIARLFRRLPVHQINAEEVVGRGAAVRAGMLARDAGLEEMVMTDVAPSSSSTATQSAGFSRGRTHQPRAKHASASATASTAA